MYRKEIKKNIFLFVICCLSSSLYANSRLDSILQILDKTLLEREEYLMQKEHRIIQLKKRLQENTGNLLEKYNLNVELYKEYKPFRSDSAIAYLNKNILIASELEDEVRKCDSKLKLSFLMSSAGMYVEAVDLLKSINRSKLPEELFADYYGCYERLYGELGYYTQNEFFSKEYFGFSRKYKDSLMSVLSPDEDACMLIREEEFRNNGQYAEAFEVNDLRLSHIEPGTPQYALVRFQRALICGANNDDEGKMYNLCLSTIADIKSAIKDHASLWMLAQMLYKKGDIERAYQYIRISWSDTQFYNARLRNWQSGEILSIIDESHQLMLKRQNVYLQYGLMLIALLLVMLIVALAYLYSHMKKLAVARNDLQHVNKRLNELNNQLNDLNQHLMSANMELTESNQIKEEYITRFMKLCSTFINKLDIYRRMVNKKLITGNIAELLKITRSQDSLNEELEELYGNFDRTFLHLFPDFVDKFNDLLLDEERICLKKGELLNTELRIFALIKLGIEDSSQIAEFLRYSVNTIYNYRAKVKNKAKVSRKNFEDLVRNIH